MKRQKILEPSLLAADPGNMAAQMVQAARGGAAMWHLDVMDGHFVKNLSFGPHVCAGLRKHTGLPVDAHLMVADPGRFVAPFLEAGASSVVLHVESGRREEIESLLREIRDAGAVPAVTLRPGTPVEDVVPFLPFVDRVLMLSVEPGYGGQEFLPESYGRIRAMRGVLDRERPGIPLQLDGGITVQNTPSLLEAGVDIFIAGSAVFGAADIEARCREFTELLLSYTER